MTSVENSTAAAIDLRSVRAVSVLGRGGKGIVFLIRTPGGDALALKAISRSSIGGSPSAYRRIWFERDVLLSLRHPLLPSLRGVLETDGVVAFAMDRCPGGDLASLRRRQTEGMFSDDAIRFYAAELVLAIEYLHGLGIVYRDLKPENVMIQENGHLMLVDFDLSTNLPSQPPIGSQQPPPPPPPAKKKHRFPGCCFSCSAGVSPDNSDIQEEEKSMGSTAATTAGKSNSFVGTEEYVAPEVIRGSGHDFAVDWWSLGVVLYEMLYGKTPFRGQNRRETFGLILRREPELVGEKTALRELIGRLLEKDPGKRITGAEVKEHEFFRGVDWESVMTVARPPFIPPPPPPPAAEEEEAIDVEKFVQDVFRDKCVQGAEEGNQDEKVKIGEFSVF